MMAKAEEATVQTNALKADRDFQIKTREVDIKEFEAKVKAEEANVKLTLEGDKIAADLAKASEKNAVELTKTRMSANKKEKGGS